MLTLLSGPGQGLQLLLEASMAAVKAVTIENVQQSRIHVDFTGVCIDRCGYAHECMYLPNAAFAVRIEACCLCFTLFILHVFTAHAVFALDKLHTCIIVKPAEGELQSKRKNHYMCVCVITCAFMFDIVGPR